MKDLADASIQIRISRKTLATIAMYFYNARDLPRTKSELGRMALEAFKSLLVHNGLVDEITDSTEATHALERAGFGGLSIGGRGEETYMKQLQREVVTGEIVTPDPFAKTKSSIEKEREQTIVELAEAAKGIAKTKGLVFDEWEAVTKMEKRDRKLKKGLREEEPETIT